MKTRFPRPFGAKAIGEFNPRRVYDAEKIGLPIRRLTASRIKITKRGIAVVVKHTARFGEDDNNEAMIRRLQMIARGEIETTEFDRNFYAHELREYVRYRFLGYETGEPESNSYEFWNDLHTAALEDYQLKEFENGRRTLYHPNLFG